MDLGNGDGFLADEVSFARARMGKTLCTKVVAVIPTPGAAA
jgi:hypothetical protein